FGHGGGRQCTSATNGMAVTTIEEIYEIIKDERFNNTSIIVEGGVGRNPGTLLALGVDCVLYNQRFIHGGIESPGGDIFFENQRGQFIQPYPGEASLPTMIVE